MKVQMFIFQNDYVSQAKILIILFRNSIMNIIVNVTENIFCRVNFTVKACFENYISEAGRSMGKYENHGVGISYL